MIDTITVLRGIPAGRAVRLTGITAAELTAIAGRYDDLPAPVLLAPSGVSGTVAGFVTDVLDALDLTARRLLPGWLPEADGIDGPHGASLAAIRAVAIRRAREVGVPSGFLADLAERALTGRPARGQRRPEIRIGGLARTVAAGFNRSRIALVIPFPSPPPAPFPRDVSQPPASFSHDVSAAGAEWLADRGRIGVWLAGEWPGRLSTVHLPSTDLTSLPGPAVAGRPHPRSSTEAALEAVLAGQAWAYGRVWNGTYQPDPLRTVIRPDLHWTAERVMVELDGPEHCRPDRYAQDRARDVLLQLDGYDVLRFTNAQVRHDVQAVAAQIGQLIRSRRHIMTKGRQRD
ncbi:MAG TPA: DUF559 domain-containing protein [Actinoplanes sp.]|nr:DUF559 domain-containing protein [Actinoplanes sp.]